MVELQKFIHLINRLDLIVHTTTHNANENGTTHATNEVCLSVYGRSFDTHWTTILNIYNGMGNGIDTYCMCNLMNRQFWCFSQFSHDSDPDDLCWFVTQTRGKIVNFMCAHGEAGSSVPILQNAITGALLIKSCLESGEPLAPTLFESRTKRIWIDMGQTKESQKCIQFDDFLSFENSFCKRPLWRLWKCAPKWTAKGMNSSGCSCMQDSWRHFL